MSVVCALRKELAGGALGTYLLQPRVWPGRGTRSFSWAPGLMEVIRLTRAYLYFLPLAASPPSPTGIFPLRSVSEFPIERCLAEIIKLLRRYLTVGAIK